MNPDDLNRVSEAILRTAVPRLPDNPAIWTYKRLVKYINDFEKELDEQHEIGARLVSFGESIVFHIVSMRAWGPDIITFIGELDTGERVQLIQNIAQLSVLLVAMKKTGERPRRIGFALQEEPDAEENDRE